MPAYKLPLRSRWATFGLIVAVVTALIVVGVAIPFVFGERI